MAQSLDELAVARCTADKVWRGGDTCVACSVGKSCLDILTLLSASSVASTLLFCCYIAIRARTGVKSFVARLIFGLVTIEGGSFSW
jgi:hypothetical protein